MDILNEIAVFIDRYTWFDGLLIPAAMCLLLAWLGGRPDELSRNAIRNTAATVVIWCLNIGVMLIFWKDLTAAMYAAYHALGIPMLPAGFWDGVPWWVTIPIVVAARDFGDYWSHRIMHTKWLWPTHAAHHSDTHVNAFTTNRVHVLEAIIMLATHVALLTWMRLPELVPVVMLISLIHNYYVHMNLPWGHGPFRLILASPQFHRWHHADVPEAYGKNLANMIPAWDWLFGTYYDPGPCPEDAPMGAVLSGVPDTDPIAIWLHPAVQWRGMIRRALRKRRKAAAPPRRIEPAE